MMNSDFNSNCDGSELNDYARRLGFDEFNQETLMCDACKEPWPIGRGEGQVWRYDGQRLLCWGCSMAEGGPTT
jgi:hypothetical protein